VLWGVSWSPTWPSCGQEVVTSALWECGSGAPRRRVLRGPCLLSKPPGKKKKKLQKRVTLERVTRYPGKQAWYELRRAVLQRR
jgi:hypothetical protein